MSKHATKQIAIAAGVALAGLALLPQAARADSIDGAWCSPDGKHLTIEGRKIKTPGGANIEGNYTRHAFQYVAPASEPSAGATIYMSLMNQTTAQVRDGTPVAQPVVWKRCENIT
jgi:hypothetical protein